MATADGPESAIQAIAAVVDKLADSDLAGVGVMGVGAAGVDSDLESAARFAALAQKRWGWPVAVASDVLAAHLGAFSGHPGTLLIAGTGTVAYRIDETGQRKRADGWGPWLGDLGSGRWIGQEGLIAVLRAYDGRGEKTGLVHEAEEHFGSLDVLPRTVGIDAASPRALASFAPVVLRVGFDGDAIAAQIVRRAVDHLIGTVASVAKAADEVAVVGGLLGENRFTEALVEELRSHDYVPHRPSGTAIDGAGLLALHHDFPHERYIIRD
jgi:N-acetylglucosamine kinase-like BadF-type ATPase